MDKQSQAGSYSRYPAASLFWAGTPGVLERRAAHQELVTVG